MTIPIFVVRKDEEHTATSKKNGTKCKKPSLTNAGRRDKLDFALKKSHWLTHCYKMRTNE